MLFRSMTQHIDYIYYGVSDYTKKYKSIGDYKHNKLTDGRSSPSFPNTDSEGVPSVMDAPTKTGIIIKHSLKFAEEVCGIMTIDENSKMEIMHYNEFKANPLPPTSQCLFGHLLVRNGDIVMKEELFNTVYNLIELRHSTILKPTSPPLPPLPLFTKCKLCSADGTRDLTIDDIIHLKYDQRIFLRNNTNNEVQPYEQFYKGDKILTGDYFKGWNDTYFFQSAIFRENNDFWVNPFKPTVGK